jgi:Putative peptidoglycan binding domain
MNMLPAVSKFKNNAIAALIAVCVALPAAPALAWGQREQDTLKGAVGALIIAGIISDATHRKPQHVELQQPNIYHEPRHEHHKPHSHNDRVISLSDTAAAQAFYSYSGGERRLIQRQLAREGYYYGGIDGAFGRGTYNAVAGYAQDNGQSIGNTAAAFGVYDGLIY